MKCCCLDRGKDDDTDLDGVSNGDEKKRGIDPNSVDSDGDGDTDGDEIKNKTDPKEPHKGRGGQGNDHQGS